MKLFRTDLTAALDDTLFEISVRDLKTSGIKFAGQNISCRLTSDVELDGYKITGSLDLTTVETCDRCLSSFNQDKTIPVSFWLTSNQDLISEVNEDIIWFPDNKDWIDLSEILRDIIYMARPIKVLCQSDCKGLCSACGHDLNQGLCSCADQSGDERWNKLKKLL